MPVITYYLGAGASANCIPVNIDFPTAVENFAKNFIYNSQRFKDKGIDLFKLENDVNAFAANVRSNPTVDIFAKKLFLQGEPLLYWFKNCLELFFLYCQHINPPDYRYEFFMASFINRGEGVPRLNENVKVITWNYDNQIELAYSRYINASTNSSFPLLQKWLKVYPFFNSEKKDRINLQDYNIVKLNGGVGLQKAMQHNYFYDRDIVIWDIGFEKNKRSLLAENHIFIIPDHIMYVLLDYYNNYIVEAIIPENLNFTYSWEGEKVSHNSKNIAQHIANQTEILIFLGYSFPFVNSQVDNDILLNMKNVKYIYIQDYSGNDDIYLSIENRLKQLFELRAQKEGPKYETYPKIRRIKFTAEFYIPPDLQL